LCFGVKNRKTKKNHFPTENGNVNAKCNLISAQKEK